MHTLTLSDVVKGPLVVLEEGVAFDLINSSAAKTNLPAHSNRTKQSDCAEQSLLSMNTKHNIPPPPPTITQHVIPNS